MKSSRIAALAAVAVLGVVGTWPAEAAGPYTIAGSGTLATATRRAFSNSNCNTAIVDSPVNGSDARIVDVSSMAGTWRTITWSTPVPPNFVLGQGQIGLSLYTGGCQEFSVPDNVFTAQSRTFFINPGVKWLVVEAFRTAQVTFHVN